MVLLEHDELLTKRQILEKKGVMRVSGLRSLAHACIGEFHSLDSDSAAICQRFSLRLGMASEAGRMEFSLGTIIETGITWR